MPKLPFMTFYPMDWIRDTRHLNDEEKSIWIDLLCFMWMREKRGSLTGQWSDLARMVGKERFAFQCAIDSLVRKGVMDIIVHDETNGDALTTLKCRRMVREQNAYEKKHFRQQRWHMRRKKDAYETDKKSEVRSHKSIKDKDIVTKQQLASKPKDPEEVTGYARSIGFSLDGRQFWDYYASKGWVVGRSPMKDWRAAVRTWKRNGYSQGGQNAGIKPASGLDKLLARETAENP